ncbi:hypothetical protein FA15DRAFT_667429 [Coprinopsis marcescibilis]|uniref:BTB domain-containing protein n=1 Tax=Coprinopsis marcescibilis TaxID=230819 RepID=A0A5C3L0Q7_COPMA|nr:hypothetical protein FA15DRAFT_667429 [Coprinopsis marcescibilis]
MHRRAGRSIKRRRVESAPAERLWFDDGNIILQAEDKQFKVHKSFLARHSKVLAGMLSAPGSGVHNPNCRTGHAATYSSTGGTSVDNCPVVTLPDSGEDWEELLTVLYDTFRKVKSTEPYQVGTLIAMLRLGHKYEFDDCKEEALTCILEEFPHQSRMRLFDYFTVNPNYHTEGIMCGPKLITFGSEHSFFDLLNVAVELRLEPILPVLLLMAVYLPAFPATIFEGTKSISGNITTLVSPSIQQLIISAREKLQRAVGDVIYPFLLDGRTIPAPKCQSRDQCEANRLKLIQTIWVPLPSLDHAFPFGRSHKLLSEHGLCARCEEIGREYTSDGHEALWNSLPRLFGLGDWATLENFKFDL